MTRSVVVTGIGAVTAIGSGSAGLWEGVLAGRSGIRPISRFDPSAFRSRLAAEVDGFEPELSQEDGKRNRMDRFALFGVVAAEQAVEDAGLCLERIDHSRIGVSLGSALGGVAYGEEQHAAYLRHGVRAVGPTLAIA